MNSVLWSFSPMGLALWMCRAMNSRICEFLQQRVQCYELSHLWLWRYECVVLWTLVSVNCHSNEFRPMNFLTYGFGAMNVSCYELSYLWIVTEINIVLWIFSHMTLALWTVMPPALVSSSSWVKEMKPQNEILHSLLGRKIVGGESSSHYSSVVLLEAQSEQQRGNHCSLSKVELYWEPPFHSNRNGAPSLAIHVFPISNDLLSTIISWPLPIYWPLISTCLYIHEISRNSYNNTLILWVGT